MVSSECIYKQEQKNIKKMNKRSKDAAAKK